MKNQCRRSGRISPAMTALLAFQAYCEEHPGSPAAVRSPRLFPRGRYWIAILGSNLTKDIAGIGETVQTALSAFDRQYLNLLRPPGDQVDPGPGAKLS